VPPVSLSFKITSLIIPPLCEYSLTIRLINMLLYLLAWLKVQIIRAIFQKLSYVSKIQMVHVIVYESISPGGYYDVTRILSRSIIIFLNVHFLFFFLLFNNDNKTFTWRNVINIFICHSYPLLQYRRTRLFFLILFGCDCEPATAVYSSGEVNAICFLPRWTVWKCKSDICLDNHIRWIDNTRQRFSIGVIEKCGLSPRSLKN